MKQLTILGATGSIGKNTLDVVALHPERFKIFALSAHSQIDILFKQCQQFNPRYAVVNKSEDATYLTSLLAKANVNTEVLHGTKALEKIACDPEVSHVMSAIVGAAGLLPTLAAAKAGKTILLANKESLVLSGELFMKTIEGSGATLLPVDSEHNAIFQCLPNNYKAGQRANHVKRMTLTASGGPFRDLPLDQFARVTPRQAVAHPNWSMGAKISVDSATMMNKGFEVIEAFWLFNLPVADLDVVIHPQSIIHSLVTYYDGSTLAQLGNPDMRTPIAYCLSWPERISTQVKPLNLHEVAKLTFEPVDVVRFPCLELAFSSLKAGGTACAILNAANEVTVSAFLDDRIKFTDIYKINADVLEKMELKDASSLEVILEEDRKAREIALGLIG